MISHGDGRKEYVGAVVREMERNGYHDSDFYALVYDRTVACADCAGTGWKNAAHEGRYSYGTDEGYFVGKGHGNDYSKMSYDLTVTLMEGSYASYRIVEDESKLKEAFPLAGCRYEKHESVKDRKFLHSVASYMGIPDPYGCETCSGSGRVPDPDGGHFKWIEWGSTRFACDAGCSVDATEEVKALYKEWVESERARMKEGLVRIKATKPEKGARVRVVKGRKVAKGTEGTVFWHGTDKFASRWASNDEFARIGFKTDDGESHFTASSNVEVLVHDGVQWVEAEIFVRSGDRDSHYMTPDHWVYASGFAYVG